MLRYLFVLHVVVSSFRSPLVTQRVQVKPEEVAEPQQEENEDEEEEVVDAEVKSDDEDTA